MRLRNLGLYDFLCFDTSRYVTMKKKVGTLEVTFCASQKNPDGLHQDF